MIVANRHFWDRFVPDYPGRFEGRVLHFGRYRNAGDLRGERVPVVGAGEMLGPDCPRTTRIGPVSVQTTSVDGALKVP